MKTMTTTNVAVSLERIKEDWDFYTQKVQNINPNNTDAFRKLHERLGYPLAKAVPALVMDIERKTRENTQMQETNQFLTHEMDRAKRDLAKMDIEMGRLKRELEKAKKKTTDEEGGKAKPK